MPPELQACRSPTTAAPLHSWDEIHSLLEGFHISTAKLPVPKPSSMHGQRATDTLAVDLASWDKPRHKHADAAFLIPGLGPSATLPNPRCAHSSVTVSSFKLSLLSCRAAHTKAARTLQPSSSSVEPTSVASAAADASRYCKETDADSNGNVTIIEAFLRNLVPAEPNVEVQPTQALPILHSALSTCHAAHASAKPPTNPAEEDAVAHPANADSVAHPPANNAAAGSIAINNIDDTPTPPADEDVAAANGAADVKPAPASNSHSEFSPEAITSAPSKVPYSAHPPSIASSICKFCNQTPHKLGCHTRDDAENAAAEDNDAEVKTLQTEATKVPKPADATSVTAAAIPTANAAAIRLASVDASDVIPTVSKGAIHTLLSSLAANHGHSDLQPAVHSRTTVSSSHPVPHLGQPRHLQLAAPESPAITCVAASGTFRPPSPAAEPGHTPALCSSASSMATLTLRPPAATTATTKIPEEISFPQGHLLHIPVDDTLYLSSCLVLLAAIRQSPLNDGSTYNSPSLPDLSNKPCQPVAPFYTSLAGASADSRQVISESTFLSKLDTLDIAYTVLPLSLEHQFSHLPFESLFHTDVQVADPTVMHPFPSTFANGISLLLRAAMLEGVLHITPPLYPISWSSTTFDPGGLTEQSPFLHPQLVPPPHPFVCFTFMLALLVIQQMVATPSLLILLPPQPLTSASTAILKDDFMLSSRLRGRICHDQSRESMHAVDLSKNVKAHAKQRSELKTRLLMKSTIDPG
ncbi:hypothetical protein GOP47_0022108 [Adiantum capillus-veneris]|uniref:Uncharacterized protein n=1 Tax=Adiantum capillus-veneris TaxID=13818 RepID=A0A9D4U8P6_ADICA|nr:hypothetical protein GOP47_0022108 [Adiantum capillus-veneris]